MTLLKFNTLLAFILLSFFTKAQTSQDITVLTSIEIYNVSRLDVVPNKFVLVCFEDSVSLVDNTNQVLFSKKGYDARISPDGELVAVLSRDGKNTFVSFFNIKGELIKKIKSNHIRTHAFGNRSDVYYYVLTSGLIIKTDLESFRKSKIKTSINPENVTSVSEIGDSKKIAVGANIRGEFLDQNGNTLSYYHTSHLSRVKTHIKNENMIVLNLASDWSSLSVFHDNDTTEIEKAYDSTYVQRERLGDINLDVETNYSMINSFDLSPSGSYIITFDQASNLNYWTISGELISSMRLKNPNVVVRFYNENTVVYFDNGLQYLKID